LFLHYLFSYQTNERELQHWRYDQYEMILGEVCVGWTQSNYKLRVFGLTRRPPSGVLHEVLLFFHDDCCIINSLILSNLLRCCHVPRQVVGTTPHRPVRANDYIIYAPLVYCRLLFASPTNAKANRRRVSAPVSPTNVKASRGRVSAPVRASITHSKPPTKFTPSRAHFPPFLIRKYVRSFDQSLISLVIPLFIIIKFESCIW